VRSAVDEFRGSKPLDDDLTFVALHLQTQAAAAPRPAAGVPAR
jgi:hypothetical protein